MLFVGFVPITHSKCRQLLFINVDDLRDTRILQVFLQLQTKHQTVTIIAEPMWAELTASRGHHITSKPVCSLSTRHWTLLLESLEVSSMVEGGTSCTARRLTGSASLCRYALLAAMLSPKLESEKLHRKASLTQKRSSHQKWDSQE